MSVCAVGNIHVVLTIDVMTKRHKRRQRGDLPKVMSGDTVAHAEAVTLSTP